MIQSMKKVELHVHLDGSVRIETLAFLSGASASEIKHICTVDKDCHDLNAYLEKFEFPLKYMQTEENLVRIAKELVEDLEKENVIYAEVRFAPLFHTKEGLTPVQVVNAVLKGLSLGNIPCNLILCMMRGVSIEENMIVLELAQKFLNKGVCAIDLAGAEALYPNSLYEPLFSKAKLLKIPYTIHAGEASGKESIYSAIQMGAKRIGHGIHIENDPELIQLLQKQNILLEICPVSNVQTQAVSSLQVHPVYDLYKMGVFLSINTDNKTVSNITLTDQYILLQSIYPFSLEDFLRIQKMAIEHAFISDSEKEKLLIELSSNL